MTISHDTPTPATLPTVLCIDDLSDDEREFLNNYRAASVGGKAVIRARLGAEHCPYRAAFPDCPRLDVVKSALGFAAEGKLTPADLKALEPFAETAVARAIANGKEAAAATAEEYLLTLRERTKDALTPAFVPDYDPVILSLAARTDEIAAGADEHQDGVEAWNDKMAALAELGEITCKWPAKSEVASRVQLAVLDAWLDDLDVNNPDEIYTLRKLVGTNTKFVAEHFGEGLPTGMAAFDRFFVRCNP